MHWPAVHTALGVVRFGDGSALRLDGPCLACYRGPKIILKGFVYSSLVPRREAYPTLKNISRTMWLLKEK